MNEKLKNHIEMLFEDAPKTRKTYDLKEELYANSLEKYQDLLHSGMNEEDAYKNVIGSIGDVSSLFSNSDIYENGGYEDPEALKKGALLKAIAIGIYIFSGALFLGIGALEDLLPGNVEWSTIGLIIMILIDIIPTCMLVYIFNTKPRYRKVDDTLVEEFREWQSDKTNSKEVRRAITGIIWTLTLVIYFTVSFLTGTWYITWVLFILAACVEAIIGLVFSLKR